MNSTDTWKKRKTQNVHCAHRDENLTLNYVPI